MHDNEIGNSHSFTHTALLYCLTNFLPDRCSTGPAIPGAECRYCPNWATTDTPESPDYLQHLPAGYSRTALSAHSLTIAYLQICPGFHRTAVLCVRAFTVLLFYVSGLSPYCVLFLSELYTNRYPHGSPYLFTEHNHQTLVS